MKAPLVSLSPKQVARVVTFSRKHYERIGPPVVHRLTEKNLGRGTLVSNYVQTGSMCSSTYHDLL